MKYLVVTGDELINHNLGNYVNLLDSAEDVDSCSRVTLPWVTPTGIVPRALTTYWIPETNRLYSLLRYTGIGWIKAT